MLRNYFVIAFRNISRNKLFSIINILGLAIGIACSFLIILDVQDDLSYDQFIEDKDDIYRVVLDRIYPENIVSYAIIPHSYAHVFASDIPEIEESTRIVTAGGEFIVTIDRSLESYRFTVFLSQVFPDGKITPVDLTLPVER